MKLLYCIPALYNSGGMERVLSTKLNYFSTIKDLEILVITTEQMGKPFFFDIDVSVKFIHLDINFLDAFDYSLIKKYLIYNQKLSKYKKLLQKVILDNKIDICISLCGKEIEFLPDLEIPCKKIAEIHFTLNYRELFLKSKNKVNIFWRTIGRFRTKQLISSISKFDKFIVLTQQDKNLLNLPNVQCIYNPNPFKGERETLKLNSKKVISLGSLIDVKGYDMLIKAWNLVNLQHKDWVLNIFGEGENRTDLELLINVNQLVDKVNLCGQTTDVKSEYEQSSIYVMSSRYEGLPMVLIEAMSCGLPIVSFDCDCGPRELVTDGVDGILVEANNIQALADSLSKLIENENLRIEMGDNALVKSKQFSINQIMPQWLALFDELMK
jgi:glycosyltransferase involved in cell wall biosynthesis